MRILRITTPEAGVTVAQADTTNLTWGFAEKSYLDLSLFDSERIRQLLIRVAETGGSNGLDALQIHGKVHPDDTVWVPLAVNADDFSCGSSPYVAMSKTYNASDAFQDHDPTTLGASQYALILLNVPGFAHLRIRGSGSGGAATVKAFVAGLHSPMDVVGGPESTDPVAIAKTVSTPSTAESLSAADLWVDSLVLEAKKVGGDNSGVVHIGSAALDQGAAEETTLAPGDSWAWLGNSVPGLRLNLKDVYVDADTADDGVTGWYTE